MDGIHWADLLLPIFKVLFHPVISFSLWLVFWDAAKDKKVVQRGEKKEEGRVGTFKITDFLVASGSSFLAR